MNLNLRVLSLNVRGLNDKTKRLGIYQFIKDKNIDIACLQETFCTINNQRKIDLDWNGSIFHCLTESAHSRGVSTLIRRSLNYNFVNMFKSNDGRRLLINIEIENEPFTIVNIYAPNVQHDQKIFFKRCENWIKQNSDATNYLIIAGDFNCTYNVNDQCSKSRNINTKHFTDFLNQ